MHDGRDIFAKGRIISFAVQKSLSFNYKKAKKFPDSKFIFLNFDL
jgi:hypothetical protein